MARSYGQFCALAHALDVAGERWSLLVVRELLTGPKRYSDLLAGLPGISTDTLAHRITALEEAGIVERRTLPPPATSKVYELTADGWDLQPALVALARWGRRRLTGATGEEFRSHWLVLSLRSMFQPDAAADAEVTIDLEVDDGRLRARVDHGRLDFDLHPDGPADAVVAAADPATLLAAVGDPDERAAALRDGRLRIDGGRAALAQLGAIFVA